MRKKILLTGGGTAGSVTPLLAIAEQITALDPEVEFLFVGTASGPERVLVEASTIPFHSIPAGKLRRYWSWQNFTDLRRTWEGYRQARAIVNWWRPDVIVAAGSFVSVPVAYAGWRAGCRLLVHQQDVRAGLANRLLSRMADIVSVTFEKSLADFPPAKVRLTGNPIRPEILSGSIRQAKQLFKLESKIPVLLALGGGTGSLFLNELVSQSAIQLIKDWQIIHLTGPGREYLSLKDQRVHQFDFLTWQMAHALAVADVVVARAGLGTITELAALGKKSVIIPMPGTHQEANAKFLSEAQAAIVLPQTTLTPEIFQKQLLDLLQDDQLQKKISANIHRLYRPDAAKTIGQLVLHLAAL